MYKCQPSVNVQHFTSAQTQTNMHVLKFVKLSPAASCPSKATAGSAGFDLYSAQETLIRPFSRALIFTDLQIAVPQGHYGRIAPRSGLAINNFIDVGAGVIDEDYRGNVGILLFNFSSEPFYVRVGDRIAQLICEKISHPTLVEAQSLDVTARATRGFGSSGTGVSLKNSM